MARDLEARVAELEAQLKRFDSLVGSKLARIERRMHEKAAQDLAGLPERIYRVRSSRWYSVRRRGDYLSCECKGFRYRNSCRHVKEIRAKMEVEKRYGF